jgi:hypothetical protein
MYRVETSDGRTFGPTDAAGLRQWLTEGRIPREALIHEEGGPSLPAWKHPVLADLAATLPAPGDAVPLPSDNTLGGLIPANNPKSLVAYYTGIFGWMPLLGLVLGPVALIFGIKGYKAYKANPQLRGRTHSLVGIIGGGIGIAINFGCVAFYLVMAIGMAVTHH